MKRACSLATVLLLFAISAPAFAQSVTPVPPLMNFQGRLAKPDGTPGTDGNHTVVFTLYDAVTGGNVKWTESKTVTARNGVFAVLLGSNTPLNETVFAADRWLELSVDGNALAPRQRIVSTAFAFKANLANTVPDASITGAKIANGTITGDKFAANVFNPLAWLLGGNSGTNGTQFLGTTDNQPLVFKVNNRQAMRYNYMEDSFRRSITIVGGADINVANDIGATVAGGGYDYLDPTHADYPNQVFDPFGTIGGGFGNTTKGGSGSVIAGGSLNTSEGYNNTIAGGYGNSARINGSSILGGFYNTANGLWATVAGGVNNQALGSASFAAGQQAQANHDGSFVWNDASDLNYQNYFASTGVNQFLVHATGGVGINTNDPAGFAVHVAGTGKFDGNLTVNSTTYTSDARYKTNVQPFVNALDTVLGLRGVSYSWDKAKWPTQNFADGRQIGFLAQEVETVLPELVVTDKDGYKSVNYIGVVPVLVEAVKTLKKENDSLRSQKDAEVAELRAEIAAMKARLDAIEKLLQTRKP